MTSIQRVGRVLSLFFAVRVCSVVAAAAVVVLIAAVVLVEEAVALVVVVAAGGRSPSSRSLKLGGINRRRNGRRVAPRRRLAADTKSLSAVRTDAHVVPGGDTNDTRTPLVSPLPISETHAKTAALSMSIWASVNTLTYA